MIVGPEDEQPVRIRIRQRFFPEQLEISGGGFGRIRNDSVGHLQPVDVGLVLEMAAEAVGERLAEERQYAANEQQQR